VLLILPANPGAAQPGPAPSPSSAAQASASLPETNGVLLVDRENEMILLAVQPLDSGSIALLLSSHAPDCRFPEAVFELPIQINETGFQLKHAIRPEQRRESDGSCTEAIATSYHPEHYWPLKAATAVTLHLPWGLLALNDAALAHLKAVTPVRAAEALPLGDDQFITVINRLTMMLSAGQVGPVREAAETLLPVFATRPPHEGFAFFSTLGMARRMSGDLAFAAISFEVATMLGTMSNGAPNVGVVYDNLATVRRLQKRWPEAEQASDRAIAALESVDDPQARQALAGVYNNRAGILMAQEQYEPALAYSEKALAILKVTLKSRSKELKPFLDDNQAIRDKLGRR
jgi:tetratricopeptide (TPR) repeat protein